VEKFGPRRLIAIGTVMAGMSWVLSAQVNGLATLWLVYGCMGGLGTGIVYIGVVGLMVKWFPQQRGFAAGAVAAGYGMGAIITTFPISLSLTTNGLEHTMTTFGILFALVGFLASQGLKLPPPAVSQPVSQTVAQSSRSFTSREMLRQPLFWLMFAMMAMMSTSGLMVTSQMAVFAEDFGISQAVVFGMAALPLALTIDRFTNGLTRPLFGFISDRFGREQTMFIAFALEGVAMMLWLACREDPLLFVLLSGVVFFGWGRSSRSSRRRSPIPSAANMPPATMAGCIFRRASGQSSAARWRHCSISTPTAGMWFSAARLVWILSPPPSRCGC
jgi:MFS family permease